MERVWVGPALVLARLLARLASESCWRQGQPTQQLSREPPELVEESIPHLRAQELPWRFRSTGARDREEVDIAPQCLLDPPGTCLLPLNAQASYLFHHLESLLRQHGIGGYHF